MADVRLLLLHSSAWNHLTWNIPRKSSSKATYLLSLKPSKSDEQGMQYTFMKIRTTS